MGKDKYICPCFKVTKDDIKKAIEEGADSFKKVKKATHLAAGCGHCKCRAKKYTNKRLGKIKLHSVKCVSSHRNISWGTRFFTYQTLSDAGRNHPEKVDIPKAFPHFM